MYLIFVVCVWFGFGIVFIDRKNWRRYYPTILFYIVMNLLFDFIYYNHTLFAYKSTTSHYINHTLITVAIDFFVMPIAITIFLQKYPNPTKDKILYILAWTLFFWVLEYIFVLKGMFIYDHGWTIWDSGWFDLMLFVLLILHNKKPLLAWAASFFGIIVFLSIFPISLSNLK